MTVFFIIVIIIAFAVLTSDFASISEAKRYKPQGKVIGTTLGGIHLMKQGEGKPSQVIFSDYGQTAPALQNKALLEKLSEVSKVALPERPGSGHSTTPKTPYSVEAYTDNLHLVFHKSELTAPYVFVADGHGALEALRFAEKYPQRVAALILLDPVGPSTAGKLPRPNESSSKAKRFFVNLGLTRLVEQLTVRAPKWHDLTEEETREYRMLYYRHLHSTQQVSAYTYLPDTGLAVVNGRDSLPQVPTCILHCDESPAFRKKPALREESLREYKALLPEARFLPVTCREGETIQDAKARIAAEVAASLQAAK